MLSARLVFVSRPFPRGALALERASLTKSSSTRRQRPHARPRQSRCRRPGRSRSIRAPEDRQRGPGTWLPRRGDPTRWALQRRRPILGARRGAQIGDAMVCAGVTNKLAKPYLYPTKASARGAQMRDAGEEVLTRLKPGNPPRRISWSVRVRFCQFFLAQFRLRRSRVYARSRFPPRRNVLDLRLRYGVAYMHGCSLYGWSLLFAER